MHKIESIVNFIFFSSTSLLRFYRRTYKVVAEQAGLCLTTSTTTVTD